MSLFSFLRKNKQESTSDNGEFYSRAEERGSKMPARAKRKQGTPNADPVDHAVPEKKRARRRLVGAVALVLAAIIGLPMILDSEQKPLSNDIAIQIPSKDTPVVSASGESRPVAASSSGSSSVSVSEAASLDVKEEIIEPVAQPQAKSEKSSIPIKGLVAPVDPEVVKTDGGDKSGNSAKTLPHEKLDDREKLKAELKPGVEPKAEAKAEPKVEHKTEPKAESRAAKKVDDAARARAILAGDTPAPVPEKKQSRFVIQVAALATQDKVNDLQEKLKEAGIKSYTQKIATASGERIRIRVGPFVSKDDADKVRAKLGKLGLNGTLVPV
jgi:DedD protein